MDIRESGIFFLLNQGLVLMKERERKNVGAGVRTLWGVKRPLVAQLEMTFIHLRDCQLGLCDRL